MDRPWPASEPAVSIEELRNQLHESIDRRLDPVIGALARLGVQPNQITVAGTLICLASPVLIVAGRLELAGVAWLAGSAFDLLDGALARRQSKVTRGGAFLDSTLDRISEGALFSAITYHFAVIGEPIVAALAVGALHRKSGV